MRAPHGTRHSIQTAPLPGLTVMGRLRNPKRERFAVEVASMTPVDRAYVLAGYRDSPWARPNGSRLAHNAQVAARIEELRGEFRKSAGLSVEYLQALLLPVAEANALDFFKTENGKLVPKTLSEMKRAHAAAIAAIKLDEDGAVELKFHNKTEAVNVLLRSIGAIVERHELDHTLAIGPESRFDRACQRLANLALEDKRALVNALETLSEEDKLAFADMVEALPEEETGGDESAPSPPGGLDR